jgi:hypothetical protein
MCQDILLYFFKKQFFYYSQVSIVLAVTLAAYVSADGGYAYAPDYYCRDTNTSVYAEICVPAFAPRVTPLTLATKNIMNGEYCFDEVLTECKETSTTVDRKICTFEYVKEEVVALCATTQVTFDKKSETMKKTSCKKASGYYAAAPSYGTPSYGAPSYGTPSYGTPSYGTPSYGAPAHGTGEHQHCREEYQTQAYRVPLVTVPNPELCRLSFPAPKQVCVTKSLVITEVKCAEKVEKKICFPVVKWVDSSMRVKEKEVVLVEPSCKQRTLTLPTQACTKKNAYKKKPY